MGSSPEIENHLENYEPFGTDKKNHFTTPLSDVFSFLSLYEMGLNPEWVNL